MTDVKSARWKLKRAEHHLRAFKRVLRGYVKAKPVSLTPKENPDPLREKLYVSLAQPPPESLNVLTGDCVHNIRCALDHLVMAMSIANGARPDSGAISFPVYRTQEDFFGKNMPIERPKNPQRGTGAYAIRRLSDEQWAFVEGLQPYNRAADAWLLNEISYLDNRDKHRLLIEHNIEATFMFAPPPGVDYIYAKRLRLEHGAYFATVVYAKDYSGMKVQPPFAASVTVERAPYPGFPDVRGFVTLPEFLDDCLRAVSKIVDDGAALPGRPAPARPQRRR